MSDSTHANEPRHLGVLLRRSQQLHARLWSTEVSTEVTPMQSIVLAAIREGGEIDFQTVARRAWLDRSTLTGVVSRLATRGYVLQRKDPHDQRRYLLSLTADGEQLAVVMRERSQRLNERLFGIIKTSDRPELIRLLELYVVAADYVFNETVHKDADTAQE